MRTYFQLRLRSYVRIGCVRNEYACCLLLDRLQRMIVVDLFREELAFCEGNLTDNRIVGLTDGLAHVCRAEYRSVLVEESLVVSEMVRVNCNDCMSCRRSILARCHIPSK